MAKKKYMKVFVYISELIPTVRKACFVNVEKCYETKNGSLVVKRSDITTTYPTETMKFEYFIKPQKRWIDDGTNIHKGRKKKKTTMA